MRGLYICSRRSRAPTSSDSGWSRSMRPWPASSVSTEPPYAEPHVRWCERAEGVTPHPTRCCCEMMRSLLLGDNPYQLALLPLGNIFHYIPIVDLHALL